MMSIITTPVTELFGIKHPVILAGAHRQPDYILKENILADAAV